jgi:hypothetical protein
MALFDNSNDIILIIGSIAGAICSIIAAVRLSRCEYVSLCKGLITIKRTMDKKKETTNNNNDMTRTPSTDTIQLENTSVEV